MASPKEYPHHFPTIARVLHNIHAPAIVLLTISGIFIRFPVWEGVRIPMRYIHYVCMYTVVINWVVRVGWAFLGKKKDYHDFAPRKLDLQVLPKTALYYAFIKKDYPHLQKFNPLQKMTYLLFTFVLPIQAYTGFALIWRKPLLSPLVSMGLFSGVATAEAYMRLFHWCGMLFFAMFTAIHVYLALTEDFYAFLYLFFIPLRGKAKALLEKGLKESHEGEPHAEKAH